VFINISLRLTTRQSVQFHGVVKDRLGPLMREINQAMIDTLAACGDVNRNVMAPPNPERSAILQQVYEHARGWSEFALPKTRSLRPPQPLPLQSLPLITSHPTLPA
jgi:sulfite reductase (NADPH) hemoprotein beta-component